jgi:hypothetical protein
MNNKLNVFLWKQRIYLLSRRVMYPVFAAVLIVLLLAQLFLTQQTKAQLEVEQNELNLLQQLASTYTSNKPLSDNERKVLSGTLMFQLPDQENIFSIIGALGELTDLTGFTIDSYSLTDNPQQKTVQISATATGTPEQIGTFLKTYQFGTSRFLTMDAFRLGLVSPDGKEVAPEPTRNDEPPNRLPDDSLVGISFTISFHTEPLPRERNALVPYLPSDHEELEKFKDDLNYDLFFTHQAASQQVTDTNYESAGELFGN